MLCADLGRVGMTRLTGGRRITNGPRIGWLSSATSDPDGHLDVLVADVVLGRLEQVAGRRVVGSTVWVYEIDVLLY